MNRCYERWCSKHDFSTIGERAVMCCRPAAATHKSNEQPHPPQPLSSCKNHAIVSAVSRCSWQSRDRLGCQHQTCRWRHQTSGWQRTPSQPRCTQSVQDIAYSCLLCSPWTCAAALAANAAHVPHITRRAAGTASTSLCFATWCVLDIWDEAGDVRPCPADVELHTVA
jgi:hypothetical protein